MGESDYIKVSEPNYMVICLLFGCLAVSGIATNAVYCGIVLIKKTLHVSCHILMSNLAVCNILYMILHVPYYVDALVLNNEPFYGRIPCKILFSSGYFSSTGSFYFMTAISLNRWAKIYGNVTSPRLPLKMNAIAVWISNHTLVMVAICWTMAIAISTPAVFIAHLDVVNIKGAGGIDIFNSSHCRGIILNIVQLTVLIFFQYCIPILVLVPVNLHICYFLSNLKDVTNTTMAKKIKENNKKRGRIISSLLLHIILQVCAWVPLFFVSILQEIAKQTSFMAHTQAKVFCLLGIILTPIIFSAGEGLKASMLKDLAVKCFCWLIGRREEPPQPEPSEAVLRARESRHRREEERRILMAAQNQANEVTPLLSHRVNLNDKQLSHVSYETNTPTDASTQSHTSSALASYQTEVTVDFHECPFDRIEFMDKEETIPRKAKDVIVTAQPDRGFTFVHVEECGPSTSGSMAVFCRPNSDEISIISENEEVNF
ncbi:unnamed protein product [Caenorhabditis auriculariae]|uniref:G-protein coupled receptors family 1 profile domain-containing protein n=1 Tax=Caenorhabditis auriculariae TaxID=2777116 RepID=A0A8S1GZI5_9PELO|nr:unnamed protein product [Caenorhabditis auriculariae]